MPGSSGSERPPDASEMISRASGGAGCAGSRAAMAHGDPTAMFRRYEQAADPAGSSSAMPGQGRGPSL
jgi:hypothetical protein